MQPPSIALRAQTGISRLLADLARAPHFDPPLGGRDVFRPGDVAGRFELLRELGRGGFGVVFEARDRELGRRVALKTVRPGAPQAQARDSLEREIEAGRLKHPNIVTVLEAGRCHRGPFVVFELLDGETVGERLSRGPLRVREVIDVAAAVTRALAHAHARGVLHRDVKPGNVFLPSRGEAKIIDFGLAHVFGSGGPRGSGTSGYMAPEQRRGGPEDARTDLFALGLLIHEMATGEALLRRRGPADPDLASSSAVPLPPALERIVERLVEHDPARRPGSAGEVLSRLREATTERRRRAATGQRGEANP